MAGHTFIFVLNFLVFVVLAVLAVAVVVVVVVVVAVAVAGQHHASTGAFTTKFPDL